MGLIPDVVIGIFHSYNPSGCTMALGSTQSLTEMSTRNISLGVLYCIVVGSQWLMPLDALQLKAYCTNPGL